MASEESIDARRVLLSERHILADQVERLYHEHYRALYAFLLVSGCSAPLAEEYLQDAFLRMVRFLRQGGRIEKPRNWLLRVLHNLRQDEEQRARRMVSLDSQTMRDLLDFHRAAAENPERDALERERTEKLAAAIANLTDRQRQYLLLRAQGMKLREIAEVFGVTVASVGEACGRAVERLGSLKL
jgi:RNA polymerase sigma-70 factor (ECF subfamily)